MVAGSPTAQAFSCQLSVTMETRRLCEFQLSPLPTTGSERSERTDNYFLIYVTLAKAIGLPKFYFFFGCVTNLLKLHVTEFLIQSTLC